MREKRPIISFRRHEDLSYCIKSGRKSGMLVPGKNFSLTKKVLSGDIDDIPIPKISHETSDVVLTCTWVCRGLDGSTCSESLPERTWDFQPPEHVRLNARTIVW